MLEPEHSDIVLHNTAFLIACVSVGALFAMFCMLVTVLAVLALGGGLSILKWAEKV
jgi:hypothetical protein